MLLSSICLVLLLITNCYYTAAATKNSTCLQKQSTTPIEAIIPEKGYSQGLFRKHPVFMNTHVEVDKPSFFQIACWWFLGCYKPTNKERYVPSHFAYPNPRNVILDQKNPMVTWVNHSTFHVKVGGFSFLTDPIWSNRCSPVHFVGPKRLHAPPFGIDALCGVDFVLISHNHYDHLDRASIKALHKKFPHICWLVPQGLKSWFITKEITNIVELTWWETYEAIINNTRISITLVPAQHSTGRGLFDQDRTLWGGFVVEVDKQEALMKRFYFVGDTGYNRKYFKAIGKKFGHMDLSLIPIGAYLPRSLMKCMHINPAEALKIHEDVSSKLSVAMHWKTFQLADDLPTQPPYYLYLALKEKKVPFDLFRVLKPGQAINF